jgi:hypothetical protein
MKNNHCLLPVLFGLTLGSLAAQPWTPLPEPDKPQSELRVEVDPGSPLVSLEKQLVGATFEQRGELATAFDAVALAVSQRVAELRAQGLNLDAAASSNLDEASDFGQQAFRDLSLSTEETWRTSRHNALMALRKIRGTLETLQRTATIEGS